MSAYLENDLIINEEQFKSAADDMKALKNRTIELKNTMIKMYDDLVDAMKTPAGNELKLEAKNTLLKPIEDMALVVGHISDTLETVIGSGYYNDVFKGFEDLSNLF